jgi:GT2 family glycosyltransferase
MKIAALVVTYNRQALLAECLDAIRGGSRKPERIFVVDNASTDGTGQLFAAGGRFHLPDIQWIRLPQNRGGAGGFHAGIEAVLKDTEKYDWIWLMDDDTIPEAGALANLLAADADLQDPSISFLASCVFGEQQEPMNVPVLSSAKADNGYETWYENLDRGAVRIDSATFVSLLISVPAARKAGLPVQEYFLWGDDSEYTRRLTVYCGPAYLVGSSRVLHKRKNAKHLNIAAETDVRRIRMYRYFYRNLLFNMSLYQSRRSAFRLALVWLLYSFKVLFSSHGWERFATVQSGVFGYFFGSRIRTALAHRIPGR